MARTVDARTLPCPQPVILTRQALEETDNVVTIVDNDIARENVSRFGRSQDCEVTVEEKNDGIYLTLTRESAGPPKEEPAENGDTVLLIASDMLGRGENSQLGSLLIHSFLNTLGAFNSKPSAIIFMNDGVKLVTEDSVAVGELKQLEALGVEVFACGTCLSRLNLADKLAVGHVSNMYDLTSVMLKAGKVISI
ncbi:MAG TPA: sulfurtransferase-like selenium metabolism protein YedF [Dehalococcoidia bacterium]|nr:sulfurtransferase-like selenium metabolism protein YedF [Dehalococcoidia bacterium]